MNVPHDLPSARMTQSTAPDEPPPTSTFNSGQTSPTPFDFDAIDPDDLVVPEWDDVDADGDWSMAVIPDETPSHTHSHAISDDDGELEYMDDPLDVDTRALEHIRTYLNAPGADWSCDEQRMAVRALHAQRGDVGVVMRTGSGKSMVVLAAAAMNKTDSLTIIVCPLIAVEAQWLKTLERFNIKAQHWQKPNDVNGRAPYVVVSLDRAKSPAFQADMQIIHATIIPISRLVFDEAHLALTERSYRPAMKNGHELRFIPFQLILMSATLPPDSEVYLENEYCMYRTSWIRTSAIGWGLGWVVREQQQDDSSVLTEIEKDMDERFQAGEMEPEEKVLIFVPTKELGKMIADEMGSGGALPFYHAKVGTMQQKRDLVAKWTSPSGPRFMVATSAFEAGSDTRHVRLVYFASCMPHMCSVLQAAGRAGRDGKYSACVMVPGPKTPWLKPEDKKDEVLTTYCGIKDVTEMYWPKSSSRHWSEGCLVKHTSRWADGFARCCHEIEELKGEQRFYCSVCIQGKLFEITISSVFLTQLRRWCSITRRATLQEVYTNETRTSCHPIICPHARQLSRTSRLRGAGTAGGEPSCYQCRDTETSDDL